MTVAVLFARADSTYKALPDCDVWDADRDARRWPGGCPVVAHPPCRAWGRLRTFARPRPDEMNLARLAVALVREFGGVLEHPAGSTLWKAQKLPRPGERDQYGGWTLEAPQKWWGHKAEKATLTRRLTQKSAAPARRPLDCRVRARLTTKKGTDMASELAMQFAAQAWCQPGTSDKGMDPALAMAFATVLDNWMETASQQARNADFYRGLLDECAQVLGPDAYTADDGTVMQDPVRLKIPALVQKLVHGACGD